ncbi:MAG TPA: hypothetical protein VFS16_13335 [Acidimicrobiia bacterium]|nr:hypothetical protein [Acidimicrobiia bacterium]
MSEDLEPIPLERPGRPDAAVAGSPAGSGADAPSSSTRSRAGGRDRRRVAAAAALLGVAVAGGSALAFVVTRDGRPPAPAPTAGTVTAPAQPGVDVPYPAVRGVPPHLSTVGQMLVTRRNPGGVDRLVLVDPSGRVVWDLPPVGNWEPTAGTWSPDGRRFLFSVSRGQETVTRVVMLPEGVDLTVDGALAWIGDNELLVWRAGRLGRLDVVSSALMTGAPQTSFVAASAGARGQVALVVIPGRDDAAAGHSVVVRFVDPALQILDAPPPAPNRIVDCFTPTWRDGTRRLLLACKQADPPGTAAYEIDRETLRWSLLPVGALQPAAVHPVLDDTSLLLETVGNCTDDPVGLWLVRGADPGSLDINAAGPERLAEADVAPDGGSVAAVSQPCGPTPHVVVFSAADGSSRDLAPGRLPLWSPARRR